MKKLALVSVLIAFVSVSCRKDYTCSCEFDDDTTIDKELLKIRKKDAEENCSAIEATYRHADTTVTCSI